MLFNYVDFVNMFRDMLSSIASIIFIIIIVSLIVGLFNIPYHISNDKRGSLYNKYRKRNR